MQNPFDKTALIVGAYKESHDYYYVPFDQTHSVFFVKSDEPLDGLPKAVTSDTNLQVTFKEFIEDIRMEGETNGTSTYDFHVYKIIGEYHCLAHI